MLLRLVAVVVVVVFAVAIIVVATIVAVVDVQANKSLFISSLPPRMVAVVVGFCS